MGETRPEGRRGAYEPMHARTMENTNRRRNAPTEAAARPRTRYSSFTADHGRKLGDVRDVLAANTANTANPLHDLLNDQRQRDQHRDQHRGRPRAGAYPPGHQQRRPAAISTGPAICSTISTEGPPRRRPILLDTGPGDLHRRRSAAAAAAAAWPIFYWPMTRRADTLKETLNKIIKTNE